MDLSKGKNKTKALISLALYQVILKQHGYENITVKDICETAGVSRMSFYRYYNKKDDIFIDYCDERFAEFYEEFFQNGNPSMHTFIVGMFSYFSKYSRQLLILKKANKQNLLMEQFDSYARYLINNWKVLKDRRDVHNNPVIAPFLSGGFFNVLMQWLDGGMKESVEEMTKALFSLFPGIEDK